MEEKDRARKFQFTINNYSQKDLKKFLILAESLELHKYICFGLESAPTTGTKHIQGYIELSQSQRFTFLHGYFNFQKNGSLLKFHVEEAKGTSQQNIDYCKKGGDFYEFGIPVVQGSRTDLIEIKNAVRENPRSLNVIVRDRVNNHQQLRFAEGLQRYYFSSRIPSDPPKVFWLYGRSGVGKTSLVYRTFDDICSVSSYGWLGTDYTQNECLLFDDFREGNVPFEQLLKICDRFPYTLFYKGGSIPLNSKYIIFTSPTSVVDSFVWTKNEDLNQLQRRVIEIDLDLELDIDSFDLRNYLTQ